MTAPLYNEIWALDSLPVIKSSNLSQAKFDLEELFEEAALKCEEFKILGRPYDLFHTTADDNWLEIGDIGGAEFGHANKFPLRMTRGQYLSCWEEVLQTIVGCIQAQVKDVGAASSNAVKVRDFHICSLQRSPLMHLDHRFTRRPRRQRISSTAAYCNVQF